MAKAVKNKQDKGAGKGGGKAGDPKGRKADAKSRSKAPAKAGARSVKRAPTKGAAGERRGLSRFFRDVRVEMGKVTWPSRQDLLQSTIVVLVAVAIAAAYVGVLDLAFSEFVKLILNVIT